MPSRRRRTLLAFFILGLLVGWLAIGWWLWPVEWANSSPWQLRMSYQKLYVALVAERYWQTANLAGAQTALAGWRREDLSQLLGVMQKETTDPAARQHLASLAQSLRVPVPVSAMTGLLSQPTILVSIAIPVLPLTAAVALVVAPRMRSRKRSPGARAAKQPDEEGVGDARAEELDAEPTPGRTPSESNGPDDLLEQPQAAQDATMPAAPPDKTPPKTAVPTKAQVDAPSTQAQPDAASTQAQANAPEASQEAAANGRSREQKDAVQQADAQPPSGQKPPQPASGQKPAAGDAKKPAGESAREDGEGKKADVALGDLLSVFEDEEGIQSALASLDSKLIQIGATGLLVQCDDVLRRMQQRKALPEQQVQEQRA